MGRRRNANPKPSNGPTIEAEPVIKDEISDDTTSFSSFVSHCHHVADIVSIKKEDLVRMQNKCCIACSTNTKARWGCLHSGCSATLCGSKEANHVSKHHKENPEHRLFIHLTNNRLFCYACEEEVHKERNAIPLSNDVKRSLTSLKRGRKNTSRNGSPEAKLVNGNRKDKKETMELSVQKVPQPTQGPPVQSDSVRNRPYMKVMEDVLDEDFPKGLTGLTNLGNTCYFNASIQVLSNCSPFSDYFRDKGDLRPFALREPLVSNQMAMLVQRLWSPQREPYISPRALLNRVREIFPQFRGYNQQDSQELIRCLLELIHRELGQPVYAYEDCYNNSKPSLRHSSTSSSESEQFETADSGWSSDGDTPSTSNDSHSLGKGSPESNGVKYRRRREPVSWRSIVTDVFDGTIESGVKCLTCQTVSNTTETFQDLSLSIPSVEQLERLGELQEDATRKSAPKDSWSSWFSWLGFLSSFFVPSAISLNDCLATFFSPDRLVGDDMYSCEKCKKLRNGIKTCRIKKSPEVLVVHIKRFRHDSYSSSKVSTKVEFPLTGLDISSYCVNDEEALYDLCGFVTHEGGGADCGHYLAYCRNEIDGNWYEYDDSTVTKLDAGYVLTKEAYVLFYQKRPTNKHERIRLAVEEYLSPVSTVKFNSREYISSEWLLKLNTFSSPGPITNYSFLCEHGHLLPRRSEHIADLCISVPSDMTNMLYKEFGGFPRVSQLHYCLVCDKRWKALKEKKELEKNKYLDMEEAVTEMMYSTDSDVLFIKHLPPSVMSKSWFQQWEKFVSDPCSEPPGPIDNSPILQKHADGSLRLKPRSNMTRLHRELFLLLRTFYGGGPEVFYMEEPQPTDETIQEFVREAEAKVHEAKEIVAKRLASHL